MFLKSILSGTSYLAGMASKVEFFNQSFLLICAFVRTVQIITSAKATITANFVWKSQKKSSKSVGGLSYRAQRGHLPATTMNVRGHRYVNGSPHTLSLSRRRLALPPQKGEECTCAPIVLPFITGKRESFEQTLERETILNIIFNFARYYHQCVGTGDVGRFPP